MSVVAFVSHGSREEAIVMANLRKRVAACDLTRKRPTPEDQNANEPENELLDNRPLLPKVSGEGGHDTCRNLKYASKRSCDGQIAVPCENQTLNFNIVYLKIPFISDMRCIIIVIV